MDDLNPYESPQSTPCMAEAEPATYGGDDPDAAAWWIFAFSLTGAVTLALLTIVAAS